MIRRPPASLIPRQFLNESLITFLVGMVVMVLSQFCTVTVCRAMSVTVPSAFWPGISIQSPTRTRPSLPICTLATKERMVSWKISMTTAVIAPSPVSTCRNFAPMSVAKIDSPASTNTASLTTCR